VEGAFVCVLEEELCVCVMCDDLSGRCRGVKLVSSLCVR
jgi:hypothetical protein